uniref:Heat shock protein family A member 12 variant X6 n=1 Tax=Urechis unicinctus TaxID=6432 RepID=A0AAU0MT83_UREUN
MASASTSELSDSFQNKSHLLVAAIDFGTTYSGYAFSAVSKKDDIRVYTDWGNVVAVPSAQKTPTVVLMRNEGNKCLAFGYDALHDYSELDEDEIDGYSIYQKFKMSLHTTKNIGRATYVPAKRGNATSAMGLFSYGLKYLAEHLIGTVGKETGESVTKDQIRWVITVPAIWSDAAKQFMRQAAFQAELIPTKDSDSLVIALEPEAASLYCRQLDINHLLCTGDSKMGVGTKYLVLDCGGGTLDVTVHHLKEGNKIAELYKATGADLGGSKVDENFIRLLEAILGDSVITSFQRSCASDFLSMMSLFEQKKRVVDPVKKQSLNIPLSSALGDLYNDMTGDRLKNAISPEWKDKGVAFKNGLLCIPHDMILGVFAPVVDKIVSHVRKLLQVEQVKAISHILVVGGFADSPYLQYELKREFGAIKKIIIPPDASSCVMKGATMFGHDPSSIISRNSRKTYGTDVYPMFDPTKHDAGKTKMYGDKLRAEGLFRTWIKQGEEVRMDKALTFSHVPVTPDQTNMSIGLYCSDHIDPRYCSDSNVEQLGNITVQLPGSGLDRKVEVKIMFGGTEITVEGRDCRPGGAKTRTTVNFLSD